MANPYLLPLKILYYPNFVEVSQNRLRSCFSYITQPFDTYRRAEFSQRLFMVRLQEFRSSPNRNKNMQYTSVDANTRKSDNRSFHDIALFFPMYGAVCF